MTVPTRERGDGIIPAVAPRSHSLFVGRARELARLEQSLDEAVEGSAAGVLVAGDAGVGKTRLTAELVRRAQARGLLAVVGHCVDLGAGGLPYLPFSEALSELARGADPDAARVVREVATARPVLARVTGRAADDRSGQDAQERLPLYEAVLEALRAVTGQVGPLLLVLEDLHWADTSTRDLLRFLLARLSDDRLLVVGTYRSDDLHRRHPLRPLLAELVRLPRVERVEVAPFDVGELRDYLRVLHGSHVPEYVLDDIRARSEGNAYYAEELLAAVEGLHGDGVPGGGARGGTGPDVRPVALPDGLAEVLLARLEGLPPAVQQVARVASVAGRRVPDVLLRAVADLDPFTGSVTVEEALRDAVAHHVLVPDGADRYAFRHALLQEAVYADLLPGERVRLHAGYARVLSARTDRAAAADLARHCLAAHDLPGALSASIRAAEAAASCLAPAEALEHYEQALQLWPVVGEADRPAGVDVDDLTLRAAASAGAAGELHRAVALAQEAVRLAGGEREAAARAQLARHLYDVERRDEAHAEVTAIRGLLAGTGPSPVRVWAAAIEARIAAYREDVELTRRLVEPALEEARTLGLAAAEADLLISLAIREGADGVADDAAERLARAERRAVDAGNPEIALRAVYNLGALRLETGDLDGALDVLRSGLADASRAGLELSVYGFESHLLLVTASVLAGEWDAALAAEAAVQARLPGAQRDVDRAQLLAVRAARDPLAALTATADLLPTARSVPWWSHVVLGPRADAQRWVGDLDGALATVALHRRLLEDAGVPYSLGQLCVLGIGTGAAADAAEVAVLRDDGPALARARETAAGFAVRAQEVATRGGPRFGVLGPEGRAWLARVRAERARADGDPDPEPWRAAVEAFGFGQRYEVARSRRHLAELLAAAGDREGAAEVAAAARHTADELRARPLRDALDALARRVRLDLGGGPAAPAVLTPREQEVMLLVAQGLTNRQIGRRLFISEKTASVHVSNVLAKLGAGGRAEAVAVAHRRGLLPSP